MTSTPRTAIVTGATSGIGLAVGPRTGQPGPPCLHLRPQRGTGSGNRQTTLRQREVSPSTASLRRPLPRRHPGHGPRRGRTLRHRSASWSTTPDAAAAGSPPTSPTTCGTTSSTPTSTACSASPGRCSPPAACAKPSWGRIINIASTAGKQGVVLGAPYSASKHGVVGFTKALGMELAPTGVTVNAVCPGYVETPMAQRSGRATPSLEHHRGRRARRSSKRRSRSAATPPPKRWPAWSAT